MRGFLAGVACALTGWFFWRAWVDYRRLVLRRDRMRDQWTEDEL